MIANLAATLCHTNNKRLIYVTQKLTNEIKSLIRDQKKEGKTGRLDLTASDVSEKLSERQLRKRRSTMMNMSQPIDVKTDEAETAGGLLSRMTQQLAWERDIDLSKGKPIIKTDTVLEEDEDDDAEDVMSSSTSRTFVALSPTPPPTNTARSANGGIDNLAFVADKHAKIAEAFPLKEFSDTGAKPPPAAAGRTNRVSPESTVVDISGKRAAATVTGRPPAAARVGQSATATRAPSARSSSGGSKQSKDSSSVLQSSSRSSLNSESSLTSLLPSMARVRSASKLTPPDTANDTEF